MNVLLQKMVSIDPLTWAIETTLAFTKSYQGKQLVLSSYCDDMGNVVSNFKVYTNTNQGNLKRKLEGSTKTLAIALDLYNQH